MSDEPKPAAWTYTMLCSHGFALYVGIAKDVEKRMAQHRSDKLWWPDVWGVMAAPHDTRAAARADEVDRIVRWRPPYNIADKPSVDLNHARWDEYRRYEIVDGRPVRVYPAPWQF